MKFDEVIAKRKSTRKFKGGVSWKNALEAIDAAIQGPFAASNNNLKFLIIEDKTKIEAIGGLCDQIWIGESSLLITVCSDDSHLENVFGDRGRIYSRQQAGAAINTLCLKLTDLGLASCWVGAYDDDAIREILKIPQNIQIEAIVPVGNAVGEETSKRKSSLENVLYWEEWENSRRKTMFEDGKETIGSKILNDVEKKKE